MTDWREELIEKMAKAAWPSDAAVKWEACLISLKQKHIDNARAALDVAEPVIREQEDNALREENARLREALKPFADAAEGFRDEVSDEYPFQFGDFRLGQCRAAAAAIREKRSFATEGGKE